MKNLIKLLFIFFLAITFVACSDDPPGIRVANENLNKANVQIKTVNNTINQNDVEPGTTTNYEDIPQGDVEVTAVIQNESISPTKNFYAGNNNNYTIVILNTAPPALRIDVSDK